MQPGLVVLVALIATIAAAATIYSFIAGASRRRHAGASLSAIDFARGSFASQLSRGVPMAELLLQLTQGLCDTFKLDRAELWLCENDQLDLAAAEPPGERPAIRITAAEQSIAANAQVSGSAWAKVWLPDLLADPPDRNLRVAPIAQSGNLLGLIVVERARRPDRLSTETDVTLEEVARELAVAINKARLDAALHASLEQLQRQARELQASRGRLVAAADAERRRIERDLHDGAQQHLVALAVRARLIEQLEGREPTRAHELLHKLQGDVSAALEELRALAHGIYPPLLSSAGLTDALSAACRRAALPASLESDEIGRPPPEVEAAVYFCCLEALQNSAKYAGEGALARVRVWERGGALNFEVIDDGAGFDVERAANGAGLTNMRDRLGAVGGTIEVASTPGRGSTVHGSVPVSNGQVASDAK